MDEAGGGAAEFTKWVEPHVGAMRRAAAAFAPSASVDDAVQEALMRAWRHRGSFDSSRGTARSWLVAIAIRQAQSLRARVGLELPLTDSSFTLQDPDGALDLRRQVGRLPRKQRAAVVLHYYVDLPVDEIAAILKVSPGTIKSNLADARSSLARYIKEPLND